MQEQMQILELAMKSIQRKAQKVKNGHVLSSEDIQIFVIDTSTAIMMIYAMLSQEKVIGKN